MKLFSGIVLAISDKGTCELSLNPIIFGLKENWFSTKETVARVSQGHCHYFYL